MRIVGVIDLLGGRAVHASGGHRERYAPVEAVAGERIDGDAVALARVYLERFALRELYVADLDAIRAGTLQERVIGALAALGAPIWLDAGVSSLPAARRAADAGGRHVIVGLETLTSFDALGAICAGLAPHGVAFGLDVRNGVPVVREGLSASTAPAVLAARAASAGAKTIVVVDLGRVGSRGGVDLATLGSVRDAVPDVALLAGGGIRAAADVEALAQARCDGALVATALHDGTITAADLARWTIAVAP